jgi:hypothetical protein
MTLVPPAHGILVAVTLPFVMDQGMAVLSVRFRLNYPNRESGIRKKIGLVMPVLLQPQWEHITSIIWDEVSSLD